MYDSQQPILSVKNLSFGYERKPVLKQVSFDVMSGDIVGLVGGNGSGKTTPCGLLHSVLLDLKPQRHDYLDQHSRSAAAHCGQKNSRAVAQNTAQRQSLICRSRNVSLRSVAQSMAHCDSNSRTGCS
jgi:ABC-type cobalamin/Fe3+-siderophores transport system ATPase subunit